MGWDLTYILMYLRYLIQYLCEYIHPSIHPSMLYATRHREKKRKRKSKPEKVQGKKKQMIDRTSEEIKTQGIMDIITGPLSHFCSLFGAEEEGG